MNAEKSQKSVQELLEFGIINIDKPQNPTSFDVSDFVRKKLNEAGIKVRKTSHFGTLDPKVTGVLPIALNRACKLTGFFLGEDKEYVGIMRIHEEISLEEIKKIIKEKFTGKILQTPPKKSRVKRQERQREVKKFELLEKNGKDILFRAEVQGGTYIRKLISDLGEFIKGAHMLELRRVRAGIFDEKRNFVNLYEFENAVDEFKNGNEKPLKEIIIPAEVVSEIYRKVEIKKDNLKQVLTGKPIHKKDLVKKVGFSEGEIISVFSNNRFIGMYKVINSEEIFAKPEFVMQEMKD
ncbi:MAG: RNA-guided pseudouridylation complex pseudouridine synthase subunit Cbf5 [archaeon]